VHRGSATRKKGKNDHAQVVLENAGREFAIDLLHMIDRKQEEIYHLLPSALYFSNRDRISTNVVECVTGSAIETLSHVFGGRRLLAAARSHLQVLIFLRSQSISQPAKRLMPGKHRIKGRRFLTLNNFHDFADQMPTIPSGPDLFDWISFAHRLYEEVDDLVRTDTVKVREY
jgi:hypothetical protein